MANYNLLNKIFKLHSYLPPINVLSHLGKTKALHTANSVSRATKYQIQLQRNLFSKNDYLSSTRKSSTQGNKSKSIDEFRAQEEQREREANENADKVNKETENSSSSNAEGEQEQESAKETNNKINTVRTKILDSALKHVHKCGWSRESLAQGAEDVGMPSVVHGMFPEGGFALVSHFNNKCNEQLVKELQALTDNGQKQIDNPLEFLVSAVRKRMEMIIPFKAKWPEALALIALPQNASTALAQVLTLVDDICYYSGDRSVNFDWYTRRIGLATIMKMTELFMLQDQSPEHANTWEFLKNRMDEAVQLQMMLTQTGDVKQSFQRSFNSAFITARNILGFGYRRD